MGASASSAAAAAWVPNTELSRRAAEQLHASLTEEELAATFDEAELTQLAGNRHVNCIIWPSLEKDDRGKVSIETVLKREMTRVRLGFGGGGGGGGGSSLGTDVFVRESMK